MPFSQLTRLAAAAPVLAFALLLLVCSQRGSAQALFGSIVENVTDARGAAVAGATVKITETSTEESRSVQTNAAGVYNLTTLPGGAYRIEITKTGFRGFLTSNVLLNQNNVVRVDVQLEVDEQNVKVEVTAEAAALQTDRADVHAEIGTQRSKICLSPTRAYEGLV
jgi:hypothetical protein